MVKYENQQEPQWTVMFADDCLRSLSRDSMDRVEGSLERWRFTLEKGADIKKVEGFKYLDVVKG